MKNDTTHHILIFDMSNMLYKTFYVNSKETDETTLIQLAFTSSFATLNKYYKLYKPSKVIFAFDRTNWRASYTQSEECYSKKLYKGHRRQSMTPTQQQMYLIFKQFITEFENVIRACTAITCLSADGLEADDIIAGVCRIYGGEDTASDNGCTFHDVIDDHSVTIVSADKDLLQLLRYKNVELIDPATGRNRTVENTGFESVDYYLYEKYMTGDAGDNVASAYPRYRKAKIKAAYNDEYLHNNLMQTEWTDIEERVIVVGEMVKENKLLTNLTHQPHDIQDKLWNTILEGCNAKKRYDHFKFLQFLGKYDLVMVSKYIDSYMPMLSLR
jgi:hypothetical protein